MRIATFNVHGWTDREGRSTTGEAIEVLRGLRCDAVVLQEVPEGSGTLARVADALGMFHATAPASFLGNALLSVAKPAAFEALFLDSGYAERRSLFVAALPWEGGSLTLAGTHLDHISERTRMKQLALVLARLDALPATDLTLLAGDLNSLCRADYDAAALERIRAVREQNWWEAPAFDVAAALSARGFHDLWRLARESGPERLATFEGAGAYGDIGTCWAGTRIDYVWASPSFGERARLVACERAASTASDHLPVVVEIAPRA
jgi:endonuclease/exonuclease/phosphatase family metal-dependent hydrolase